MRKITIRRTPEQEAVWVARVAALAAEMVAKPVAEKAAAAEEEWDILVEETADGRVFRRVPVAPGGPVEARAQMEAAALAAKERRRVKEEHRKAAEREEARETARVAKAAKRKADAEHKRAMKAHAEWVAAKEKREQEEWEAADRWRRENPGQSRFFVIPPLDSVPQPSTCGPGGGPNGVSGPVPSTHSEWTRGRNRLG